jgi:hypothetical protein
MLDRIVQLPHGYGLVFDIQAKPAHAHKPSHMEVERLMMAKWTTANKVI